MFAINSFLRTPAGEFVAVDAATDRPADPAYIEGALEIVVDGVEITGQREWDYIDQLWSYLADMVADLRSRGHASTYYPDQPIKLELTRQGSRVLVASTAGTQVRRGSVDHKEFDRVVRAAGETFFRRIGELLPDQADSYASARSTLAG